MAILFDIFIKVVSMSLIASMIGILIVLGKAIFKNIPIRLSNILWLFVLFVLIVPIDIPTKISVHNYIPVNETINLMAFEQVGNVLNEREGNKNVASNMFDFKTIITLIWFIGMILLFLKSVCWLVLQSINGKSNEKINEKIYNIFLQCKSDLKIANDIELVLQDKIKTPAIYGVVTPKLLITKEIEKLTTNEIKYIFTHELIHYKKKDILVYRILNTLKCIYWFNPIVLFILKKIKKDLEYATDEITVNILKNEKMYCKTLLKVSLFANEKYTNVLAMYNGTKELERRIKMLKSNKKVNILTIGLLIVLCIITLTATISLATSKMNTNKISDIVVSNINEYVRPVEGGVISANFGTRIHPITKQEISHNGIDIAVENGTDVIATLSGVVEVAGYNGEKGNYIKIVHEKSASEYCHLSKILVHEGMQVNKEDKIGEVGSTGYSTGPHLHFSIIDSTGQYVDPTNYIKF